MKKALLCSVLLVMLLAACGSKATTTPTPTPAATTVTTPVGAKPGECQVATNPIFVPQPASAATYAPINTATDHIEGPDTALITLIEYSDFT